MRDEITINGVALDPLPAWDAREMGAGTVSEKQETRRVKLRAEARKISQKLGEASVSIDSVKLAMVSLGYTKGGKVQ